MKKSTKIIIFSLIGLFLASVIVGPYLIITKGKKPQYDIFEAQISEIKQEVSATGKIKPVETVDLGFERTGKISGIFVAVGEKVQSGQTLVSQENLDVKSQVSQYSASLEKSLADLEALKKGARPEEIQVSQTKYENAKQTRADALIDLNNAQNKASIDLSNVYDDVPDVLQEALATADDAINKQIDALFINDQTDNPSLTFQTTNLEKENATKNQRVKARDALSNFQALVGSLSILDYQKLDSALATTEANLIIIRDFLATLNEALNLSSGLSQTNLNTYKGYVNTARSNVNSSLSSINTQKQAIATQKATNQNNIATAQSALNTAQNNLKLAEDELNLKKSPATEEQIASQEAQVKSARANLANAKAQLEKTIILSPIPGIISKQEAKIGQIVLAQSPIVSIISESDFEVEVFIAEADIAKIKQENQAKITLDAYGDDVNFQAQVTSIDPAETMVEGVATYKTILQFTAKDERIKSGMTANIDIMTAKKQGVLAVPARAVIEKNGNKFVKILFGNKEVREIEVQTGLRGSDGTIEIISGLSEKDQVIISSN